MAIYPEVPKAQYNPAPEGLHRAVCVDVIDLGIQPGYQQKPTHQVRLIWEIDKVDPDTEERYRVMNTYTLSLHEKSNLSQHLEAWRGKKFTDIERFGDPNTPDRRGRFDVELVKGANCQIQIGHTIKEGGKTWPDILAITEPPKGVEKLECLHYKRKETPKPEDEDNGYPAPTDDDGPPF